MSRRWRGAAAANNQMYRLWVSFGIYGGTTWDRKNRLLCTECMHWTLCSASFFCFQMQITGNNATTALTHRKDPAHSRAKLNRWRCLTSCWLWKYVCIIVGALIHLYFLLSFFIPSFALKILDKANERRNDHNNNNGRSSSSNIIQIFTWKYITTHVVIIIYLSS